MGSQKLGTDSRGLLLQTLLTSRCLKIQKYGRLWPWQIILKKFRSSQSRLLDAPTSAGCKVYCCGQPTVAGFEACLTKVCGDIYPKDGKIIWFNLRQEPSIYINGEPACARPPNKIGEY